MQKEGEGITCVCSLDGVSLFCCLFLWYSLVLPQL